MLFTHSGCPRVARADGLPRRARRARPCHSGPLRRRLHTSAHAQAAHTHRQKGMRMEIRRSVVGTAGTAVHPGALLSWLLSSLPRFHASAGAAAAAAPSKPAFTRAAMARCSTAARSSATPTPLESSRS